jgi:hypothetical protein
VLLHWLSSCSLLSSSLMSSANKTMSSVKHIQDKNFPFVLTPQSSQFIPWKISSSIVVNNFEEMVSPCLICHIMENFWLILWSLITEMALL